MSKSNFELIGTIKAKNNEQLATDLHNICIANYDYIIENGKELLAEAIQVNNILGVRLLLAHQADELITMEQHQELRSLSINNSCEINGLLNASVALNIIPLEIRRKLRSDYFCTFIREEYDWYYALYNKNSMRYYGELLNDEASNAYICFLNRLAKIDSFSNVAKKGLNIFDQEYNLNSSKKIILVIDYIMNDLIPYIINKDLSLATILEIIFKHSNLFIQTEEIIWEEYKQFAEIRCIDKIINPEKKISDFMQDDNFCLLHINYSKNVNRTNFNFNTKRFFEKKDLKRAISNPKLFLQHIANDCFSFMSFVKNNKELLPVVMPMVLGDEILFSRIFLGLNGAENKLPLSDILESTAPLLESYKAQIEEEMLFWKLYLDKEIDLLDNLMSIIQQAIVNSNQRLFSRIIQEIQSALNNFKVNEALLSEFDKVMQNVLKHKALLAENKEPYNQLSNKLTTMNLLEAFISDLKKIENNLRIPSLKLLSMYSLLSNNNKEEMEFIENNEELKEFKNEVMRKAEFLL